MPVSTASSASFVSAWALRLQAALRGLIRLLLPLLSWRNWLLAAQVVWGAAQRFSRGAGISHGAAVAFFTALSLAPLLVVATKVMVLLLSRDAVQQQLLGYMSTWLGPQETQFLSELIQRALNTQYDLSLDNRTAWIALATTLIGATAVFIELRTALLGMATHPTETFSLWGLLKVRILAAGIVIGASFLLSVALLLQTASQMLVAWLSTRVELLVPVVQIADLLLGLFFIGLVFALLIRALSGLGMSKRHAAMAGAVGAVLFMLGRYAIGWYIAHSATQSALGAAGSLTVILIWVYWTGQIFLFSGAVGIELTERSREALEAMEPPPPASATPAAPESPCEPQPEPAPDSATAPPKAPPMTTLPLTMPPSSAPHAPTVLPPLALPWQPVSPRLLLGEGVTWSVDQQAFFGCDIDAGLVWRLKFDGATLDAQFEPVAHFTDPSACVQNPFGEWLVSARDGIYVCSADFSQQRLWVASPFDTATQRWNDARVGPDGAFWLMTIYEPRQPPLARLYRLAQRGDGSAALDPVMQGLTVGNGLNWSADGQTLLWADTTAHSIYRAAMPLPGAEQTDPQLAGPQMPDSATQTPVLRLTKKPDLAEGEAYGGRPDGCARDETGHFWSACFEGGQLLRFALDGSAVQAVPLPVRCPTLPCFGGPDGRTLVVTSASHKRPADELAAHPHSGQILACRSDIAGPPPSLFQSSGRFF